MIRTRRLFLVLSSIVVLYGCAAGETATKTAIADSTNLSRETAYSGCGACHLPDGTGVSGVFPPLRNRFQKIAMSPAGRDYLVAVILDGMNGAIVADGVAYSGFMQPHRQSLSDAEISAALNYVIFALSDSPAGGVQEFSANEVTRVRSKSLTHPVDNRERRKTLNID